MMKFVAFFLIEIFGSILLAMFIAWVFIFVSEIHRRCFSRDWCLQEYQTVPKDDPSTCGDLITTSTGKRGVVICTFPGETTKGLKVRYLRWWEA